jgi:NitT/TauT family transport system ATP-binding protein
MPLAEIETKNLGLIYKIRRQKKESGPATLEALKGINLKVEKGEFLSIVGPSGCGKTTLLYVLAGLQKKTSGAAYLGGHEITKPTLDSGIIMQQYALFPWRTIIKNVEFGLEIKKVNRSRREEIAKKFIALVGLSEFENRYPYELSGGMKQRIAIARALAYDPEVLLMDEPFAAVDEQTRSSLHELLLKIWEDTKKTIVFVTHSIDEAVLLSDRVVVMKSAPGEIKKIIDINIERPRSERIKGSEIFRRLRTKVWQSLQGEAEITREIKTEAVKLEAELNDIWQ